ncbi:MAG: RNase adapter RapZ [Succinivibrionaceae bacterium]|jgi:UPF0042 nucleotide-binding protein|nr:RNase adapter RapZ [Succinivibrionaceae bacterium]
MELVIVSGRSGAGKTVALRCIEDLGYYCVDNLPVVLLPNLVEISRGKYDRIAVSIDVRNLPTDPNSVHEVLQTIQQVDELKIVSLFIDADDAILIKRYSETRRIHPLTKLGNFSLEQAIKQESSLLAPLSTYTDLRIDTGNLNIYSLSEIITTRLLGRKSKELVIVIESFGFKNGNPKDADFVFDARFLPNPHWIPKLRSLTGLDEAVIEYLKSKEEVVEFINQIDVFINNWLPQIERNNRSYLTVAIGCTGGQHRSVYIAEQLAERFKNRNKTVQIRHLSLENTLKIKNK